MVSEKIYELEKRINSIETGIKEINFFVVN